MKTSYSFIHSQSYSFKVDSLVMIVFIASLWSYYRPFIKDDMMASHPMRSQGNRLSILEATSSNLSFFIGSLLLIPRPPF